MTTSDDKTDLVKMDWCSFCREEMFDDGFMHGVWDKLRFGDPICVTEEEWARQAKRHKLDCPWIKARGDCFWTA